MLQRFNLFTRNRQGSNAELPPLPTPDPAKLDEVLRRSRLLLASGPLPQSLFYGKSAAGTLTFVPAPDQGRDRLATRATVERESFYSTETLRDRDQLLQAWSICRALQLMQGEVKVREFIAGMATSEPGARAISK
jgi:hypothetical protein